MTRKQIIQEKGRLVSIKYLNKNGYYNKMTGLIQAVTMQNVVFRIKGEQIEQIIPIVNVDQIKRAKKKAV